MEQRVNILADGSIGACVVRLVSCCVAARTKAGAGIRMACARHRLSAPMGELRQTPVVSQFAFIARPSLRPPEATGPKEIYPCREGSDPAACFYKRRLCSSRIPTNALPRVASLYTEIEP